MAQEMAMQTVLTMAPQKELQMGRLMALKRAARTATETVSPTAQEMELQRGPQKAR